MSLRDTERERCKWSFFHLDRGSLSDLELAERSTWWTLRFDAEMGFASKKNRGDLSCFNLSTVRDVGEMCLKKAASPPCDGGDYNNDRSKVKIITLPSA